MNVWISSLRTAAQEVGAISVVCPIVMVVLYPLIFAAKLLLGEIGWQGVGHFFELYLGFFLVGLGTGAFIFVVLFLPWTLWVRWSIWKDNQLKPKPRLVVRKAKSEIAD